MLVFATISARVTFQVKVSESGHLSETSRNFFIGSDITIEAIKQLKLV